MSHDRRATPAEARPLSADGPASRRISLSLVVHNHQPVGNFGWVFEEVYEKAYEPLVAAIERHPRLHLGLHYSGPLLEWLREQRPAFIDRLRGLVDGGQVEILGGGLYEPVLASLPQRDRVGQLERMAARLEEVFGIRPTGAWLAERVWEPDLPTSLVAAGYRYTILDDAHLRSAAIAEEAMWGPYTTDDQGHRLIVFGTEQGLRYRIPFQSVESVIEYLRDHATEAGERLGMMGDDGEKFGAWPTTWEHCWGRGRWVESFLEALEANAGWLTTVRPSDWLAERPPIGRTYVPTGSYAEMGEWALPADESAAFAEAMQRARESGAPEARWLRGGFWRNFQVKYREVNDLHKQMLRASAAVAAMPDGPGADAARAREAALDHLYRGQSNDSYWHGLFGGIYIPHMRAATLTHLIAAEDLADAALGRLEAAEIADLDLDGRDEVRLATPGQVVTIKLDEGAGIGSWDLRAVRHALAAVLRRRPERYHRLLLNQAAPAAAAPGSPSDAPASIHELVRAKESGLERLLRYDAYERRSGLVRALPLDASADDWAAGGGADVGRPDAPATMAELGARRLVTLDDAVLAGWPITIRRELTLGGDRLDPSLRLRLAIENRGEAVLRARLGLEWAITMLGGGGNPSAWWEVGGARSRHDGAGAASDVSRLAQGNDWLGLRLDTEVAPSAEAWWAPIETISNSEDGFERVYQGSALLVSWPVAIAPGGRWAAGVEHRVTLTSDHGSGEIGGGCA